MAVAKKIGGDEAKLVSIPQIIDSDVSYFKDDVIGLVFPVYFYTVPKMVGRFLKKIRFEAKYTFAIGTQGGMNGACMRVVQNLAKASGYSFDYLAALDIMSNFLPRFCVDREVAKMPKKKPDKNLARIIEDIKNRKHKASRPNIFKSLATKAASSMFKYPQNNAQKYIIDDKCNMCGVCQKVCPAKNIELTDKVIFADKCEYCFACLHLCPQNALHHKRQKSEKRWRNPDVTLAEIVAANSHF